MPSRLRPQLGPTVQVCNKCGLAKGGLRGQISRLLIAIMKSHELCIYFHV